MNDYYNDPLETPEPPECCGQFMEVNAHGNCSCLICGNIKSMDYYPDIEPLDDPYYERQYERADNFYTEQKDRELSED